MWICEKTGCGTCKKLVPRGVLLTTLNSGPSITIHAVVLVRKHNELLEETKGTTGSPTVDAWTNHLMTLIDSACC